jgi:hypothetical protein
MGSDAATLVDSLGGQRRHVLGILDGLSDADWRRSVVPSGWSPIQLVSHLALDDERFWLGAVLAGDPEVIDQLLHDPWEAWKVAPDVRPAEIVERYRAEAALGDARILAADLDAPVDFWPDFMGPCFLESKREVVPHLLTETAAHAGQLDIVRELIDGRQWMVVT